MEKIPALIEAIKKECPHLMLQAIKADTPAHWAKPLSYTINSKSEVITLNLKGAALTKLPITANWQHLQRLDISHNAFSELIFDIDLPQLELLEMSYNQSLEKLTFNTPFKKLKYLYVYDCQLRGIDFKQGLPPALLNESSNINLKGNQLATDLLDILAQEDGEDKRNRLKYYFKQEKEYVKRVKLILLGNTDTGKTTLHDKLTKQQKAGKSTHGINIFDYTTSGEAIPVKGFDFGGQDYYHSTHFSFFGSNALYLLLWGKGQPDTWGTVPRITEDGQERQETIYPRNYWLGAVQLYTHQTNTLNRNSPGPQETALATTTHPTASTNETVHLHLLYNRPENENDNVKIWLNQHDIKNLYPFVEGFHQYCLKTADIDDIKRWIDNLVQTFAVEQAYPADGQTVATILAQQKSNVLLSVAELKKNQALKALNDDAITALLQGLHALQDCYYLAPAALQEQPLELLKQQQTDEQQAQQQQRLTEYVITDLDKFTSWLYAILGPETLGDGYFNKAQAIKRLTKASKSVPSTEQVDFILDFMLYHKIIFRVKDDARYIAPNYLPAITSTAELLFLETFEPPLVQYEFSGFFHSNVLTEILARYILHNVPVQQEGNSKTLRYILWKNKVLLCEDETAADKPMQRHKLLLLDFEPPQAKENTDEKKETMNREPTNTEPPPSGPKGELPLIRLHRLPHSQVSDDFIRQVMEEVEKVITGYEYTKWIVTPSQRNYIPYNCLLKVMTEGGKKTGMVQHEDKIYRLGDFKLFVNNPDDYPMKKVFISYSKDDLALVNQFLKHLAPLQRNGLIEKWYCTELMAGSDWDATIQAHFDAADMICFMVSHHFWATDYIYQHELKKAFDRKGKDNAFKIVPIIMEYCSWTGNDQYDLSKYTALPYIAKPIADFKDPNMGWYVVVESLKYLIQNFHEDPTGDDTYVNFAYPEQSKQLKKIFERIVQGLVDNNS